MSIEDLSSKAELGAWLAEYLEQNPLPMSAVEGLQQAAGTAVSDSDELLRVVRGTVNTTEGAILSGKGFTVARTATGRVLITFKSKFKDTPSVAFGPVANLSVGDGGPGVAAVEVQLETLAEAAIDGIFSFIAVGSA